MRQPKQDNEPAKEPEKDGGNKGDAHCCCFFSAVEHNASDIGEVAGMDVTKNKRLRKELTYVMKNIAMAAWEPGDRPVADDVSGETAGGGAVPGGVVAGGGAVGSGLGWHI